MADVGGLDHWPFQSQINCRHRAWDKLQKRSDQHVLLDHLMHYHLLNLPIFQLPSHEIACWTRVIPSAERVVPFSKMNSKIDWSINHTPACSSTSLLSHALVGVKLWSRWRNHVVVAVSFCEILSCWSCSYCQHSASCDIELWTDNRADMDALKKLV